MSNNDNNAPVKQHEYDGIREFDNPLPMWWLMTFLGTIIFSFIYVIHYHTNTNQLIQDEYQADLLTLKNSPNSGGNDPVSVEELNAVAADRPQLEKGHAIFISRCVACHGADGGGGIGPNLCDNSWIHGRGKPDEIAQIVQRGVADKGMPAWGSMMDRNEVIQVSAFVYSLKGSKPVNPKAPQGQKVE